MFVVTLTPLCGVFSMYQYYPYHEWEMFVEEKGKVTAFIANVSVRVYIRWKGVRAHSKTGKVVPIMNGCLE